MAKKNEKNNLKQKTNRQRFQRHFRKFHSKETTGHPSYVYDEKGNVYKVLGITSASKTNEVLNIKLEKNPEPNNTDSAYIQPKSKDIPKGTKNKKLKGWKFSDKDKQTVQKIIDNNEEKKKPRKKSGAKK